MQHPHQIVFIIFSPILFIFLILLRNVEKIFHVYV